MRPSVSSLVLALFAAGAVTPGHAMADSARSSAPAAASTSSTALSPVEVTATVYSDASSIGSLNGTPINDVPVSINLIDRKRLRDIQPRSLSEALRVDASVNASYAPVGYYQNFSIRGFPLDLATGYRINGLSVAGEQRMVFANKRSIQVLKGLAGIQAGVVAPGGLINMVSERPAEVREVTLGTDSEGSRKVILDFGSWLTPDFGIRFNLLWNDINSYVDHVDGRRNFYSLAADWHISPDATLHLDSGYASSAQRSVSGYQPLGGTTLPPDPHATWLLGYQPWQQPTVIRTINNSARLNWGIARNWELRLAAGHSRSVIDDRVAFAWGCWSVPACASGELPANAFAPDGTYDIYDFRSPDDTRRNSEARAILTGRLGHGTVRHVLTVGFDALRRTVDQRGWVYEYVGSGNIHERTPPVYPPSPLEPGPSARLLTSWQHAVLASDRIHFGEHWQALVGARQVRLDETNRDSDGALLRRTELTQTLPQVAMLWLPNEAATAYVSYGEGLSLGQQAPSWTSNANEFLPPLTSKQWEAGFKFRRAGLQMSAALFRMQRPFQFAMPDDSAAGFTFIQRGVERHVGLELALHGKVTPQLRLDASVAWTRARLHDLGLPAYEGHQTINVPELRSTLAADYQPAALPGLHLLATWRHSGPRAAALDGSVQTDGHDLFDLGLRYRMTHGRNTLTWRLIASNVLDEFYWRDTGGNYGDYYLFPGPPRQMRLSVSWSF